MDRYLCAGASGCGKEIFAKTDERARQMWERHVRRHRYDPFAQPMTPAHIHPTLVQTFNSVDMKANADRDARELSGSQNGGKPAPRRKWYLSRAWMQG